MASRVLSYARRTPGVRVPAPKVGERRWIDAEDELPFVLGATLPASGELSAMLNGKADEAEKSPQDIFIHNARRQQARVRFFNAAGAAS